MYNLLDPSLFYYLAGTVFVFGLLIGSFLNVFIYRFRTGKSLRGSSHCLSCREPLRAIDLVPLFSYLCLRGRCYRCGSRIPARYFIVELATGVLFILTFLTTSDIYLLPLYLFMMAVLVVIVVYDIYHLIVPDSLVLTLLFIAILDNVYQFYLLRDAEVLGLDVLSAVSASAFLGLLWYVSKGKWIGFGDVKLVFPLALLVHSHGVFSVIVLSFWIGAILSLLYMAYLKISQRGQSALLGGSLPLTMKSEVPFAPFMILAFLAVFLGGVNVLDFFAFSW